MVQAGQVDTIIVWAYDRLYRQGKNLKRILDLAKSTGLNLHSVVAGNIDLGTPFGRAQASVAAAFSTYEGDSRTARQTLAYRGGSHTVQTATRRLRTALLSRCPQRLPSCVRSTAGTTTVGSPGTRSCATQTTAD